jgi:3-hydroxy-9,10-secoandrosta-1,3,5(10)-triene-9,17-dione monooxygenase
MVAGSQKQGTAQPVAADAGDRVYATTIARTKALVPQLRERAARTEELRRLPSETEQDLHEAGLFRILQPKRFGGSELDYVALIDCADLLGQADASVAWNFANLASHHWMLGMFEP